MAIAEDFGFWLENYPDTSYWIYQLDNGEKLGPFVVRMQPSYNPLMYRFMGWCNEAEGYKYIFKVYANGILVRTIKYPGSIDGSGIVDLSKILKDQLSYDFNPTSNLITVPTGCVVSYNTTFTQEAAGAFWMTQNGLSNPSEIWILGADNSAHGKLVSSLIAPDGLTFSAPEPYYLKYISSSTDPFLGSYAIYKLYLESSFTTLVTMSSANGYYLGYIQTEGNIFNISSNVFLPYAYNTSGLLFWPEYMLQSQESVALNVAFEYDSFLDWSNGWDYTCTNENSKFLTTAPRSKTVYDSEYETLSLLQLPRRIVTYAANLDTNINPLYDPGDFYHTIIDRKQRNGDFTHGFDSWYQTGSGAAWTLNADGKPTTTASPGNPSKILYQDICFEDLHRYMIHIENTGTATVNLKVDDGDLDFSVPIIEDTLFDGGVVCRIGIQASSSSGTKTLTLDTIQLWDYDSTVNPQDRSRTYDDYVTTIQYKFYDSEGNLLDTENVTNTNFATYTYEWQDNFTVQSLTYKQPATFTDIDKLRLDVGVGPANISSYLSVNPTTSYYTVQAMRQLCCDPVGSPDIPVYTPMSEIFTFEIQDDCSKNERIRLTWINQLGAPDYYTFHAVLNRNLSIQKSTYKRNLTYNYTAQDRGQQVFHGQYDKSLVITTDWIQADVCEWLKSLFLSKAVNILESDGTLVPIVVTNEEFNYKIQGKDKLYRLEVEIRYSNRYKTNI